MSNWDLTLRGRFYLRNEKATIGVVGLGSVDIFVRRVRRSHFRQSSGFNLRVQESSSSPILKRRLALPLSGLDSPCTHGTIEGALAFMDVSPDLQTPVTERILSFASDLAAAGPDSARSGFYVRATLKIITSEEVVTVHEELTDGAPPPPPEDRSVLKTKKRRRLDGDADPRTDPDSCSICLDDLSGDDSRLTKLPCDHIFHDPCITRWLRTKNSCPLCRYKFDDL